MINLRKKKIIVTFLMHLGDLILITPFLQVLRRHAQGSDITLVVDEKSGRRRPLQPRYRSLDHHR